MSYAGWLYRVCRRSRISALLLLTCAIVCVELCLLMYNHERYSIAIYQWSNNRLQDASAINQPKCDTCSGLTEKSEDLTYGETEKKRGRIKGKDSWKLNLTLESSRLLSPLQNKLYVDDDSWPAMFQDWHNAASVQCGGNFVGYDYEFAYLKNAVVDMAHCNGVHGGEPIKAVMNQDEESEYYRYTAGCFQLGCMAMPAYVFNEEMHVSQWMSSLRRDSAAPVQHTETRFTVAVLRFEYANIYHTMTDWYNVFALMQFFNRTQADTDVVLVDGHPRGQLDAVWRRLFQNVYRVSALRQRTRFSRLVWATPGYRSPLMSHDALDVPLLEQFRAFFLASHLLDSTPRALDCRRLDILFVWRRDYLAHPRNPLGRVGRKVANERQLISHARKLWPWARVHGAQLDAFNMHTQLRLISTADILVGMHGAGLTHTLFLPAHGGLVEIKPPYWQEHGHFEAIARWRHLHYAVWLNEDEETMDSYSYVPLNMISECLGEIVRKICPGFTIKSV